MPDDSEEPEVLDDGSSTGPIRVIKRYPNRKLYDTHERSFTSLRKLERLVKDGWNLQVIEHATGEDITEDTLAQVLRSSRRAEVEVLSAMIRTPGKIARSVINDDRDEAREELRRLREQVRALSQGLDEILGASDPDPDGGPAKGKKAA